MTSTGTRNSLPCRKSKHNLTATEHAYRQNNDKRASGRVLQCTLTQCHSRIQYISGNSGRVKRHIFQFQEIQGVKRQAQRLALQQHTCYAYYSISYFTGSTLLNTRLHRHSVYSAVPGSTHCSPPPPSASATRQRTIHERLKKWCCKNRWKTSF